MANHQTDGWLHSPEAIQAREDLVNKMTMNPLGMAVCYHADNTLTIAGPYVHLECDYCPSRVEGSLRSGVDLRLPAYCFFLE